MNSDKLFNLPKSTIYRFFFFFWKLYKLVCSDKSHLANCSQTIQSNLMVSKCQHHQEGNYITYKMNVTCWRRLVATSSRNMFQIFGQINAVFITFQFSVIDNVSPSTSLTVFSCFMSFLLAKRSDGSGCSKSSPIFSCAGITVLLEVSSSISLFSNFSISELVPTSKIFLQGFFNIIWTLCTA